jgi:hypothetical protein
MSQRIKIFKNVESSISALEDEVNAWLAESGARVVDIVGNIAPQTSGKPSAQGLGGGAYGTSDVLLIVLYEL